MSVWLLPENIADMLPRETRSIEKLRTEFLSLVTSHGFEQIRPPMVEYVESLLTGTGGDLDLRTFKLTDQLTGRLLGLRADMTPQVARIDAHILNRPGVSRLCYVGSVLHARPLHPMASRQPYVAGVELFGSESPESEVEVIRLGVQALHRFGVNDVHLDFGHVGLVRSLLDGKDIAEADIALILEALSHKDVTTIRALKGRVAEDILEALVTIARVFGDYSALSELEAYFRGNAKALAAIERVRKLAELSGAELVSFDFSDVHGYQYLTGVTFSVTIPKRFQAVLRGGRYDDIGAKYGRKRPAVGFTVYLREISSLLDTSRPYAILAPNAPQDAKLAEKVQELRSAGKIVVSALPEDSIASLEASFRLDEELELVNGEWSVKRRFSKI